LSQSGANKARPKPYPAQSWRKSAQIGPKRSAGEAEATGALSARPPMRAKAKGPDGPAGD